MKKLAFFVSVTLLWAAQMFAAPVDIDTAKALGLKYLKNNVLSAKNINAVEHVYTLNDENEVPCLYIFNYDGGFVVLAADDRAYPVLGYSNESCFDADNIPDGMRYFLGHFGRQIQYAVDNELVAEEEIASQWELLRKEGITTRTRMNKAVSPLLATTWDQDYPYNYYAPACNNSWLGNHCYAGCVATSMSQVMKFWNWPETGVGEHSYNTSSYPGNGAALSANFGEATYNWAIMPNSLGSQANDAAKAVALLMYHCGVSVDMDFSPNGSGAHTEDVAPALINYFRYGLNASVKSRDSYTKTKWEDMLVAQLDRGLPMVYAGYGNNGGHAFNCDGYNDSRMFHFNWGWSGMGNNYFQLDALNTANGSFNDYQRAVFDIMPDYVYSAVVPAIETLNAEVENAITKTVTLSWVVPATSLSGDALASVQRIVLKRNGTTIQTFNNPQPGDLVAFEDEVADYGAYEYSIVGVNNDHEGVSFSQVVVVGPSCTWRLICQTTNFQGWNDGILQIVCANGVIFKEITMTSSSPLSEKIRLPEGDFSLNWVAPMTTVSSITITLKNPANQTVYTFSGSSAQLNGTVFSGNNDCPECTAPTGFAGEFVYQNGVSGTLLSWNCDYSPSKFKIYRSNDGVEYAEVDNVDGSVHEYFDDIENGTYYYKVTAYNSACESDPAQTPDNVDYVTVTVASVAENSINARVYPNPTMGNLKIEADNLNKVAVYNLVGQKVYEENINGDESVINMKEFGSGVYMVKITTATGSITQKISVVE